MKKIIALAIFTTVISAFVFSQEDGLTISGEVKTGLYWEEKKDEKDEEPVTTIKFYNNDDAGSSSGRFRLNLQYEKNNIGMKARIQWDNWRNAAPDWTYAFGYGRFFDKQLELSFGKLGASPWGTGGPEMWAELESLIHGGIRVEYRPSWLPGLNAGFVLNHYDSNDDAGFGAKDVTLGVILQETVLGVSYDHELFAGTFAYRLDSEGDRRDRGTSGKEGDEMLYRLEERVLTNYLPGLKVWANGSWEGIGAESDDCINYLNWLYGEYAPDNFTAQLRFGYDVIANRSVFHARPSFYYHFFDKLLTAGTSFTFAQDFGEGKMYADSPFLYWFVEPQIKIDFGNVYVAFVYHYGHEYKYHTDPPKQQLQWFNMRMALTF
jgi:hypothetical protein